MSLFSSRLVLAGCLDLVRVQRTISDHKCAGRLAVVLSGAPISFPCPDHKLTYCHPAVLHKLNQSLKLRATFSLLSGHPKTCHGKRRHPTPGLMYRVVTVSQLERASHKIRLGFSGARYVCRLKLTNIQFKGPCWIHYIRTPVVKGSPDSDASPICICTKSTQRVHGKAAQTAP